MPFEIFRQPKSLQTVKARPALAAKRGNQIDVPPELLGVETNGALAVIYTPNDLSILFVLGVLCQIHFH